MGWDGEENDSIQSNRALANLEHIRKFSVVSLFAHFMKFFSSTETLEMETITFFLHANGIGRDPTIHLARALVETGIFLSIRNYLDQKYPVWMLAFLTGSLSSATPEDPET